eukprot:3872081-Pyramimonas_sp.AAC.1
MRTLRRSVVNRFGTVLCWPWAGLEPPWRRLCLAEGGMVAMSGRLESLFSGFSGGRLGVLRGGLGAI